MTIGYNNETRRCVRNPDIEAGHWYNDADGTLYIVPVDGEVEGPDDTAADSLSQAYRQTSFQSVDHAMIASSLGLEVVHQWQQRFDPEIGYYTV